MPHFWPAELWTMAIAAGCTARETAFFAPAWDTGGARNSGIGRIFTRNAKYFRRRMRSTLSRAGS